MAIAPRQRQGQQGVAPRSSGQVPNRLLTFDRFEKMNTKVMRQNLLEQEAAWLENLQPIAPNDLKVVPGPQASPLAHLGGLASAIARLFFANVDPNDYIIAFTVGGGGYSINCDTGAVVNFAPEGTFVQPDMTVWASQRILILDEKAGYSTWDGTTFITAGGLSPNIVITNGGSGFATPPTVSFVGGNGVGATATAQISGGSVVGVTLTNGGTGFLPGDQVSVVFGAPGGSANGSGTIQAVAGGHLDEHTFTLINGGGPFSTSPDVVFSGGSGSGAAAQARLDASGSVVGILLNDRGTGYIPGETVNVTFVAAGPGAGATATVNVMPQIFGTTLDVFAGRVWTGNGRLLSFTGVGGFDDLDPANAAGSTTITDYDLVHSITAIRNRNNLLFIFGDQSVRIIGSISVQFSVTLFTPVTLSSDIGTSFLMTIVSYNRLLFFCNKHGVYGIFGSTVQKVSDDLDGIFINADFALEPSAALNDMNNIHCYLLLLRYNDPQRGPRSIICVFQQSSSSAWFVTAQGDALTSIVWAPLQSTLLIETFGTSGNDITWLLQDPNAIMRIKLQTSLSAASEPVLAKVAIRAGIAAYSRPVQIQNFTLDTENHKLPYALTTRANQFFFPYTSVDGYGKFIGATVEFSASNYNLNAVAIEFQDADLWGILPERS